MAARAARSRTTSRSSDRGEALPLIQSGKVRELYDAGDDRC